MNRLGIFTGADLRRQSLAFLQQHFGNSGPWFHAISNGEDHRPVVPDRPRRSSGSETTFANDLTDPTNRGLRTSDSGRGLGLVGEGAGLLAEP
jgi:DNA polymerase-4